MPTRYLVITADDYGIGTERDRGIADCYRAGAVTRTSLLVNGVSAVSAVRLAKQINMPLGLHLNLTEGNHISSREKVSSLLNREGYFLGMFGFPEALSAGKIDLSQPTVVYKNKRMARQLVITADDYGIGTERDRGIADCYRAGAVTRTSLLVNGVSAASAVRLAKQINMPLGLHLNLTEGNPVSTLEDSTLVGNNGYMRGKMGFRNALSTGIVKVSQVEIEIRAQIDSFTQMTGSLPTYVDGHQHVHVLPGVREVFASTLRDYGIKWTRLPAENLDQWHCPNQAKLDFKTSLVQDSLAAEDIFRASHIKHTDKFFGITTMGQDMTIYELENLLSKAFDTDNKRSCELMVHPGYPCTDGVGGCGDGPDDFTKSADRQLELEVLTSDQLLTFYKEYNIQLCVHPTCTTQQ